MTNEHGIELYPSGIAAVEIKLIAAKEARDIRLIERLNKEMAIEIEWENELDLMEVDNVDSIG